MINKPLPTEPSPEQRPESKTMLKRMEQFRDRWTSFGSQMGLEALSDKLSAAELKEFELFRDYDDKFLEKISPDISIATWKEGAVLFEQGTYVDLAFFVIEGQVEVFLQGGGGSVAAGMPIFDQSRTMMVSSMAPAAPMDGTMLASALPAPPSPRAQRTEVNNITLLASMDFDLPRGEGTTLGPGEIFGEIGAMSGWPQSVTACTATPCQLLQIRTPALRMMKRKSKALKERLDRVYRDRSLFAQLKSTPLLCQASDFFLQGLKEAVELVSCDPGESVVREGEEVDALYLIRSGFLKLEQRFGEGELVVSYLSKGMTMGEVELLVDGLARWEVSATSVEYSELVKIPVEAFGNLRKGYPEMEELLWRSATARVKEIGLARRNLAHAEFTQVALERGLVEGSSILVIDLDSCTRCDDCVRACAATHDGRARFVREGEKVANLLVTRSCYHCRDPVCLVGCPTGAIHRAGWEAVIEVEEEICIGCQTCANNCPYDAIVMHETGEQWSDDMVPSGLRGRERLVSSKCDLCGHTDHGPACVENCPQGCAYRVSSLEEIQELIRED